MLNNETQEIEDRYSNTKHLEKKGLPHLRRIALLGLIGLLIGGIIAYYLGLRWANGVVLGGISGSAIGWTIYGIEQYRKTK